MGSKNDFTDGIGKRFFFINFQLQTIILTNQKTKKNIRWKNILG